MASNRLSIQNWQRQLASVGYYTDSPDLLSQTALALHDMTLMRKSAVAVLLDGPPGTGKTFLPESLAKLLGTETPTRKLGIQFTQGVGREVMMHDIDIAAVVNAQVQQAHKGGEKVKPEDLIIPGVLQTALTRSHEEKVILVLDEIDKAKPYVDAMLLEFLQECAVQHPIERGQVITGNPANLLVFLTKNNERGITEPLMRRCRSVYLGWPKEDTELAIVRKLARDMLKTWDTPPAEKLDGLAKSIITFANKVRKREAVLRKVPSSPELAQAVVDALRVDADLVGKVVARQLFKYVEDYKAYVEATKGSEDEVHEEKLRGMLAQFVR